MLIDTKAEIIKLSLETISQIAMTEGSSKGQISILKSGIVRPLLDLALGDVNNTPVRIKV
jgi:hypothetical protein